MESPFHFPVAYIGLGLMLTYLCWLIAYRCFLHPLAKYPGPLLGKFTSILPILSMVRRQRLVWQYEMLNTYGSPVRIAHNELLFGDAKSWADIYGQSSNPCLKEKKFYDSFTVTGYGSILNERDRAAHARLRRLVSHSFSLNGLLQNEDVIRSRINTLDERVFAAPAARGEAVDIFNKMVEHYLDIVSYLAFAESLDTLSGKSEVTHHDMDQFMVVVPTQSFLPQLRYLPIKTIQDAYRDLGKLVSFAESRVEVFGARCAKDPAFAKGTFLRNLMDAVDADTGTKFEKNELLENTIIFLLAGSDTTAVTAVYAIWSLCRNPQAYKAFTEEIRAAFPDPKRDPTFEVTSELPYLQAVIKETLRLHGPLSSAFPRVSPGRQISGVYVPKGVIVSTSNYTSSRDPTVFPNPSEFLPDRWLHATPEMRNSSRPFSYGPRNCVGRHLAEIGLQLTLSRLFQLYDLSVAPSMTESMMRPCDRGVTIPWERKLVVIPKRLAPSLVSG